MSMMYINTDLLYKILLKRYIDIIKEYNLIEEEKNEYCFKLAIFFPQAVTSIIVRLSSRRVDLSLVNL